MTEYNLDSLREILAKLRGPQGCPWDQEQTHQSLIKYLLEETYEVIDAINKGIPELLADELGDLLLQIVFHAQIAEENLDFTMDDSIKAICEKLIRRHPHVFSDVQVESVSDVLHNWEAIKKQETLSKNRTSLLDGIPPYLPALARAEQIQAKVGKVGFQWDQVDGALHKLQEELAEFEEAVTNNSKEAIEEELGDLLFSLVNIARYLETNPELALQKTSNKFIKRFQYIEEKAKEANQELVNMTLSEMDLLWEQAKLYFRKKPQ